jgi:hypothetical protein
MYATASTEMRRQGKLVGEATHKDNTSLVQGEPTWKSYNLRKRKNETEKIEQGKENITCLDLKANLSNIRFVVIHAF